jgi:hypothetical protein
LHRGAHLILTASLLCACSGIAQSEGAYVIADAAVQSCIDDNLDQVEQAFDSLSDASDFVVGRICALELTKSEVHYRAENERRKEIAIVEACGELKAGTDSVDRLLEGPFDVDASIEHQKTEQCHMEFRFKNPFQNKYQYEALPEASVVHSAYASRRLLELRTTRLNGENIGDN